MDTKGLTSALCKKYNTRDPFELAACRNVLVVEEPLAAIHGYYARSHRQQVIHINCDLDEQQKKLTCGHELGHSIMHPNISTPFLRAATYYSVDKLELQANHFMVDLNFDDSDLQECLGWNIEQIANFMGVPVKLAEYRMSSVTPQQKNFTL